jgi:allantoate deiminase
MTTVEVSITGTGNHAGATPMKYRRDAMAAAALCIAEVERIADEDQEGILVATTGKVVVFPNCSNVIPDKVVFTFEVREKREEKIRNAVRKIEEEIGKITRQRGIFCEMRVVAESRPFFMDDRIIRLIDQTAKERGIPYRRMDSGAVHDTCMIAPHAPSGMLYVPSKGGRSHVPFEDTDEEDLVCGTQLLLETVLLI